MDKRKRVLVYTDGSCIGNPGKGGYGVIIKEGRRLKSFSGSIPYSTNNRMELSAVIKGLAAVAPGSAVTVYSDSNYVVNAFAGGLLEQW